MNKLIVCDVCDTLFHSNTTFDFIRFYLKRKSFWKRVAFALLTSHLSPVFYGLVGLGRATRNDLIRTLAIRLLNGAGVEALRTEAENFYVQVLVNRKNEPVFKLIEGMRVGNTLMLVSSSLQPVVCVISNYLSCAYIASELQYTGNVYTGVLATDLTGKKHVAVRSLHGTDKSALVVITDNRSDVELVRSASERYVVIKHDREKVFWKELSPTYINV
jgi:phosphoserine phosphatase